jgi:P4 family phage/plasmid primase-like protien
MDLDQIHNLGFKLIPLDENGKPVEAWTPIYENPNYWSRERLAREPHKFKNVATCFGKTHLKDEGEDLYLNCLDIDSESVYKILFNLTNPTTEKEFSFIAKAMEKTFVTKTRKPNGFHIYWLSHEQNKAISTVDCKPGFEFEIKTDKRGHCTLPPSTHRDDNNFHYKNFGQDTIIISDKMYDEIMMVLSECLKTQSEDDQKCYSDLSNKFGSRIDLGNEEIQIISDSISSYYKHGARHSIVYGLCGLLHKHGVIQESTINIIQILAKDDEERKSRLATLEETYKKDPKAVSGIRYFVDVLEHATTDSAIAKEILEKILRIIGGKQKPVLWLTDSIMKEYTFKTMIDNEDIYYYHNDRGLYVPRGDWLIKEQCELIRPESTTHEIQEAINHIKRKTGVERSEFDSNPDILNLQNGLLNIHTRQLSVHSQDYLSVVQLPVTHKPRTVCPKILQFFRDVLRSADIHVVLQMIGYCLYRSNEFEKAFMLFGDGANGKGVLIKLIEALLGQSNCSHRSLQDLDKNRFAAADLYGKLANTCPDLKSLKLSETGNFKMIVSGDSITAERKFEHPFTFRNYAKPIFSANEIPESDDKTDAFYRRWRIFHFDKKFQNGKEDPRLIKELTTADELSGLLNLALICLKQLIHERGFHDKDVEQTRRDYEENTNDVNAFLYQECKVDITNPEYSVLATDAYAAYVNFCVQRRTRAVDMNVFGKKLAARGIYNIRHRDHGPKEAYYDGLLLREHIRGTLD